jgi:hypothetical protein
MLYRVLIFYAEDDNITYKDRIGIGTPTVHTEARVLSVYRSSYTYCTFVFNFFRYRCFMKSRLLIFSDIVVSFKVLYFTYFLCRSSAVCGVWFAY